MDNFELGERKGRNKWNEYINGKCPLEFTEEKYNGVDFYMTGITGIEYVGEIKNINRGYTKYGDFQFDYGKYLGLMDKYHTTGRIPLLVVYFTDTWIVWDLSKVDQKIMEKRSHDVYCTANCAGNYKKGQVKKTETNLYKSEAYLIDGNKHGNN